jgi:formylglycine-generating enzyme required for sulfatase activity
MWGQFDLVGNVSEWELDWFGSFTEPCDNCADMLGTPMSGYANRTAGGGDFGAPLGDIMDASDEGWSPSERSYSTGARCARSP